jgi:RNA polymerase sigma factor (sigma-70 family)
MLTGQFRTVASSSHAEVAAGRDGAMNDEQLLDQFLNLDDETAEAAFRTIVVRHGPMVLGVCRHVLHQHQDAEDAFQATFLVLSRKADSIRDRRVLARWLYEVAYRIAIRARTEDGRRRAHERQGGEMVATVPIDDRGWNELRPVLHEEVNRLPEKYRTPVILCYLEGKTNEEVAEILKWPVGTVKGRLSRARDLLRSRLTRRGLALSAVLLVTALSNGTVIADVVSIRLVDETVAGALIVADRKAAGAGTIAPRISRMMDLAAPPPWGAHAMVVATLILVIVSALANFGMSFGTTFDPRQGLGSFLSPPVGEPVLTPPSPSPVAVESCHSTDSTTPATP